MNYNKQNFIKGQILKADHLNAIEDGIVSNSEELDQLKDDIDNIDKIINGGAYTVEQEWIAGKYVNNVARKLSNYDLAKYSNVIIRKGETISISNAVSDTATVVDLLSKWTNAWEYESSIKAFGSVNTPETAEYTATEEEEYLRVCYISNSVVPVVKITSDGITRSLIELSVRGSEITRDVSSMKENAIYSYSGKLSLTEITGKYINNVGVIKTLDGYAYTESIKIYKGDSITITSIDPSGANVSRVSRWTSSGKYIETLSFGSSATNTYTHTATETVEYIRFSYNTNKTKYPISITGNIKVIPSNFENAVTSITDGSNDVIIPSVAMFEKVTVCGDSYVIGQIWRNGSVVGNRPNLAWGSVMGRINGIDVSICASSGADTSIWQERTSCLPKLLSEDASGLYVFCLGINDYLHSIPVGTISDIHDDYTQNPVSYFGNYGRILSQAMAHAPNAKFIVMPPFYKTNSPYYSYSIDALRQIASHFEIMLIDTATSELVNSDFFVPNMDGGHPTSVLHSAMAVDIAKLIGICMKENPAYFCVYS